MIVSKQLNNLEDDLPFVLGVLREWSLFHVIFTLTILCWVVVQVTVNQKELFDLFRRSKDLYSNPLCYYTGQWMNLLWLRLRSEFKSHFQGYLPVITNIMIEWIFPIKINSKNNVAYLYHIFYDYICTLNHSYKASL